MQYRIITDFDGTITLQDSNARLVEVLGNEVNAQIELDFIAGVLGNREAFVQHFQHMKISMAEYTRFLDEHITLDPEFDAFLCFCNEYSLPITIVSAGFRQGIQHILGEERLQGVEILANDLIGNNSLQPRFAMENPPCDRTNQPCGNCKRVVIREKKQVEEQMVYIGDGISDFCAAQDADVVYAKGSLARYCEENGVEYIPFVRFGDVVRSLREIIETL